jgi:S1-C subfamily serine protease
VEIRQPGEKVRLKVIRGGKPVEIEVTLDEER